MPRRCSAASASSIVCASVSASSSGIAPRASRDRERLAVEQLHHEKRLAVGLVELVERTDVRVADARGGARLAAEALARAFVGDGLRTHDLDGDGPIQPVVVRGVHDAHAALADHPRDAIASDVRRQHDGSLQTRMSVPAELQFPCLRA